MHRGSWQTTHNTGKLKQDVLFKKLGFKEIGVNSHGVVEGYLSLRSPTGSGENLFHIRPFVFDLFEHGEREVVEKVFLVCFPLISLTKNQVSSLNEKGVKAAVLGPGQKVLKRKLKMPVFLGKYTTLCLQSRCAFKWVLNTDNKK